MVARVSIFIIEVATILLFSYVLLGDFSTSVSSNVWYVSFITYLLVGAVPKIRRFIKGHNFQNR